MVIGQNSRMLSYRACYTCGPCDIRLRSFLVPCASTKATNRDVQCLKASNPIRYPFWCSSHGASAGDLWPHGAAPIESRLPATLLQEQTARQYIIHCSSTRNTTPSARAKTMAQAMTRNDLQSATIPLSSGVARLRDIQLLQLDKD